MAGDTQERIREAMLELLSRRGYDGTSMSDIASALGLSKAALYKHFRSKEEIRASLLDSIEQYYAARLGSAEHLPEIPDSREAFVALAMRMAEFTVRDERIVKVRRIMTIEQFRDRRMRELAAQHFLRWPESIFSKLFAGMMEKGLLLKDDPDMLAFAYAAPVSLLIQHCDRAPEETDAVLAQIRAFTEHFMDIYGGRA